MAADNSIEIRQSGYGHWKISVIHRRKRISATTTNSMAIDDYRDDDERKSNNAARILRAEVIRKNNGVIH